MKQKISVTLSLDVLAGIDRRAGNGNSRSALIEQVLRRFLAQQERARINARELKLLNKCADELNAEAADVLGYQALWD
jgi:metal-responsive CopG/Arc/MetJ family transcriptional regulator